MARTAEHRSSQQQPLFEPDKAKCLRLAVDNLPGQTNSVRENLERLISLCEGFSRGSGRPCELTRKEICDKLRWGRTRLADMQKLAAALGWIQVVPSLDPDGGQSANRIHVCWPQIQRASRQTPLPETGTPLPETGTPLPETGTLPERANKELRNHDHDHEVLISNSHIHDHPGGAQRATVRGDAALPNLKPAELASFDAVERLRPRAVKFFGLPDSESGQLSLHAMARQALAGKKPGGLFREMLRNRAWTLPPEAKFSIAAWAEDEARSLLASHNRAVPRARLPPEVPAADPDADLAASSAAHIRAAEQLAERWAVR
jgi:hypothetical protein